MEIVAVVLVSVAAILAALRLVLDWVYSWRTLMARRVIVNLKSGRGVDGLLVRKSGDLLFIREATALEPGATPQAIDGETVVQRGDIDFIQTLVRGGV